MTPEQRQILDFITGYVREKKISPTYSEMAKATGRVRSSCHSPCKQLMARGYLRTEGSNRNRNIVPANPVAAPMSDDIIDRVAKEIAAQVSAHVAQMYPAAAQAVAWGSASRSIQGVVRNNMALAARAAESGTIDQCLRDMRARRIAGLQPADMRDAMA